MPRFQADNSCRLVDIPRAPIRFERADNPLYPLPKDYASLNPEAQRAARLNALGIAGAPDCTPTELVWVWSFFRSYYLRQTPPGFFYKRFKPSPPFHYQMVRDIGTYQLNAVAAPRGFSKSTVLVLEIPMLFTLVRPYFSTLLVFSKDVMVVKRMKVQLAYQFRENPYFLADFGDLCGTRGQSTWNAHLMQFPNGAVISAMSVKSSGLGERPDLILPDDVEFDPVLNKESPELSDNYRRLMLNHFIPMLDEGGSSLYQIGTLLSKQTFLYHMLTSNDPQFKTFNRRLLDAEDDGAGKLLWPQKFSRVRLVREKEKLGLSAYNAQRRNRPGSGDIVLLPVHEQLGRYDIEQMDAEYTENPFASRAQIVTHHGPPTNPQKITYPFSHFLSGLFRVLTFDYAKCLSPTSDYRAYAVIGLCLQGERKGCWFILDLVLNKEPGDDAWVRHFWRLARKWRVHYSGIEAVAAQETLVGTANTYLSPTDFGSSAVWSPRGAVPIVYKHGLSKEERISAALGWRFRNHQVVLPGALRNTHPWRELYHEIENFTGLAGATRYDDALDAVAMAHPLLKGKRGSGPIETVTQGSYNCAESVRRGEYETPDGLQLGLGLMPGEMTADLINEVVFRDLHRRAEEHAQESYR